MITLPCVDIKGGGGGAARPLCLCVECSVNAETRCATSSRSSNGGKFCVTDTLGSDVPKTQACFCLLPRGAPYQLSYLQPSEKMKTPGVRQGTIFTLIY